MSSKKRIDELNKKIEYITEKPLGNLDGLEIDNQVLCYFKRLF